MTTEQIILAKLNELKGFDLSKIRENVDKIISCHCDVLQAIYDAKVNIEPSEVFLETLIIKIIFASKSIHDLSLSTSIKLIKTPGILKIIDTPSLYILARSILESFLTLEYLYFNSLDREEQIFRYNLWKASGLISRQSYEIKVIMELKEKKKQEKNRIKELIIEIENSPLYPTLKKQQLWKLDNYGLPRLLSWNKLLDESRLSNDIFRDVYSLYSNYAHSEFISLMQVNEGSLSKSDKLNISNVELTLSIVRMVNAVSIEYLKNRFKCSEIIFNSLPSGLINSIKIWSEIAQKEIRY